jgi:hypothetical protein
VLEKPKPILKNRKPAGDVKGGGGDGDGQTTDGRRRRRFDRRGNKKPAGAGKQEEKVEAAQ